MNTLQKSSTRIADLAVGIRTAVPTQLVFISIILVVTKSDVLDVVALG